MGRRWLAAKKEKEAVDLETGQAKPQGKGVRRTIRLSQYVQGSLSTTLWHAFPVERQAENGYIWGKPVDLGVKEGQNTTGR